MQFKDESRRINGVDLVYTEAGEGRPILFLNGAEALHRSGPWMEQAAQGNRILAPVHPGYADSPLASQIQTVGDLALLYLEFLDQLKLRDVVLIGASFGGWIAAEMAVRSNERLSHLVLINSLGFKFLGREEREIQDIYGLDAGKLQALRFFKPEFRSEDYAAMSEQEVARIVQSRSSETLYGWRPYMHNPTLKDWLCRVRVPTLVVWGSEDGIAPVAYGRRIAEAINGATFAKIDEAGHYPHVECPAETFKVTRSFIEQTAQRRE